MIPAWIDDQENELLVNWITRTSAPMMACRPCGDILWVNTAFENMTGYSSAEMQQLTWRDLTHDHADESADLAMIEYLRQGKRISYRITKEYKRKASGPVKVVVDVMRFPISGEFECILVTSIPADEGVDFALRQVTEIRELILELVSAKENPSIDLSALWQWMNENKFATGVIAFVFSFLLFGDRVYEIVSRFMGSGE